MKLQKISILFFGTLLLSVIAFLQPLRFIDNLWYDLHFTFVASDAGDSVVVVGIDEESISRYGAFPWKRSLIAALVEKIDAASPRTIAIDILFPRRDDPEGNDSLADVFSRVPSLVLPFRAEGISLEPPPVKVAVSSFLFGFRIPRIINQKKMDNITLYAAGKISAADTLFSKYARYGGFLNVSTSSSTQKIREAVQVVTVGEEYYSSFAVASAAAYYGVKPDSYTLDGSGGIILGDKRIPISSYAGTTPINFRNEKKPVKVIPASLILDGSVPRDELAGKLVFVGVTDPAAGADFFTTPIASQVPGVVMWATLASDILEGTVLKAPPIALTLLSILLLFFLFPGMALLFSARKRRIALLVGAVTLCLSLLISIQVFSSMHVIWHFPSILYGWFFSLLWLAALRADPTLGGRLAMTLRPEHVPEGALPGPPSEMELSEKLPKTATTDFITRILLERAKETTGNQDTLSGTILEVARENLAAQPHPRPLVDDVNSIPRDLGGGTIVRLLGTGGMADVYLVWHPRLEAYRAVKVMKPDCSEKFLKRFETEIRIIAKLEHANIVHCYNVGEWHTLPYLEMEYVHGASMEEVLQRWYNITVEQTLIIGMLVCRALHYAHTRTMTIYGERYQGIIHRDLKPANIMLSRSGQVKLTDFGIARPEEVSLHTGNAGSIVGTIPYLAPEQLGSEKFTSSVDVYALGVTMYEMVTGERAFPQTEIPQLLKAKSAGAFKSLERAAHVAPEVVKVIEKAMATESSQRYATAGEFELELEKVLFKLCGYNAGSHMETLIERIWKKG